jgi:sn-glycerol 3-phosphate transport system substrate-binding protein
MQSVVTRVLGVVAVAAVALLGGARDAEPRTEIQFWHAMEGQLQEAVDELVKQFNQSQTAFEVHAAHKGTYPEILASAIAAYRRKDPPHIVQVYEVGTQSMILSRAIIPITRLMQQQKIPISWTDFIETVRAYYSQDGKLYSMPFNSSSPILYYNKEALRKAGLPDKPPATWKEVEAVSRKILAAGTATCGFTASWPSWTMLENTFAWHNQPFATADNGYRGLDAKLLINGGFGLMHIGALARWQKEHIFSYGGRMDQPDAKFVSGECAMLVQSSAVIGGFKKTLAFDWGAGQLPHWGPPYPKTNTILGGATLWVLRRRDPADYKGVAEFMRFLAEPRQQAWWAATTGYVPITGAAVRNLKDGAFFAKNPEQWTAMSELLNAKPTANSRGLRLGNYVQVRDVIEQELESIFQGRKTVKQGLDAAVTRGNAILREFAVTHKAWPGAI